MSVPVLRNDPTDLPGHPSLEETAAFAATVHARQVDKAGAPYVDHLIRVTRHLMRLFGDVSPVERHAAWLHDVIEDTPVTADDLRGRGYAWEVVAMVEAVTRTPGSGHSYAAWIDKLARSGPPGAIRVKIADLTDNADPSRLAVLEPGKAASLRQRYCRALAKLSAAIGCQFEPHDHKDECVPLTLWMPAADRWALDEAARLAGCDAAAFALEEIVDIAHRILAEGGTGTIDLARDRAARDAPFIEGFRQSMRKHEPVEAWSRNQPADRQPMADGAPERAKGS